MFYRFTAVSSIPVQISMAGGLFRDSMEGLIW
jgi:hypothetical protein